MGNLESSQNLFSFTETEPTKHPLRPYMRKFHYNDKKSFKNALYMQNQTFTGHTDICKKSTTKAVNTTKILCVFPNFSWCRKESHESQSHCLLILVLNSFKFNEDSIRNQKITIHNFSINVSLEKWLQESILHDPPSKCWLKLTMVTGVVEKLRSMHD